MHPLFVMFLIACAIWFFACAAMAGKGVIARCGFGVLGVLEFLVMFAVLEQVMKRQNFFLDALRSGPDMGPILTYIVLPSMIVVFLSGLLLKRNLARPPSAKDKPT